MLYLSHSEKGKRVNASGSARLSSVTLVVDISSFQKCDEKNENGVCQTCARLRLQCLGWGAKRPDWLRVSNLFHPHFRRSIADLSTLVCYPYTSLRSPTLCLVSMPPFRANLSLRHYYFLSSRTEYIGSRCGPKNS